MADICNHAPVPRVVLIEGNPLVRFGQELLLNDWGYRVVSGTSPEAICAALGDAPGDVAAIIADFDLGTDESGIDVARAVAKGARRRVPTIFMSERLGGAQAELGGFAYLAKPADPDRLRDWLAMATAAQ